MLKLVLTESYKSWICFDGERKHFVTVSCIKLRMNLNKSSFDKKIQLVFSISEFSNEYVDWFEPVTTLQPYNPN